MPARARVFAPASASNLGPGFDVLGLALEAPGDLVEVEASDGPGVDLVEVTGDGGLLSRDPAVNVAGVAAGDVLRRIGSRTGVRMRLHKRMPMASGLGSSAASSVAGAVAVNALAGGPLSKRDLMASALEGERAASGTVHADNVAPSLLGGVTLIRSYTPLEVVELPSPASLWVVVVHPHCSVRTAEARALVAERRYAIQDCVANLGNIGALVAALYRDDIELLGRAVTDRLVEPVRAHLIPAHDEVRRAATRAGAAGCSISGSGPSMFAFCDSAEAAGRVAAAMAAEFRDVAGLESDSYLGKVNPEGARVLADAAD